MTEERNSNDALFERQAELCKVFGNAKRLKILDLLKGGECNVSKISEATGIAQPTVSQHLGKMREQGVVTKRDVGLETRYSIADERIVDGMDTMHEVMLDRLEDDRSLAQDQ